MTRSTRCMLPLAVCLLMGFAVQAQQADAEPKRVAALIGDWYPNSHPDVIVGRILNGYRTDGTGQRPALTLATLYRDLPGERDISAELAQKHGFAMVHSVHEALTAGGDTIAVDGVLICTEGAPYMKTALGQTRHPHRRLFAEAAAVMRAHGRVVPVFIDKHIADNWEDSLWIVERAKEWGIPLMAGSSVPTAWRQPAADVDPQRPLKEIVGVSYHTLDGYGFHGMEMVQSLAEQRPGGERGIVAVHCLTGDAVWEAAGKLYDVELLEAAIARQSRQLPEGKAWRDSVKNPVLFHMEHADGLLVNLLTLSGWVREWSAAWRYGDEAAELVSTLFQLDERAPYMHFAMLVEGIETLVHKGASPWPAERTLLTSGALHALLMSQHQDGQRLATPWLNVVYESDWRWEQPEPPADAYK